MGTTKVKVTASMEGDLVEWMDAQVGKKRFASRTHALEYAITMLKEAERGAIASEAAYV